MTHWSLRQDPLLAGHYLGTRPAPCCQGTLTRGTLCTSFCSFLSRFVFQSSPGLAEHLSPVGTDTCTRLTTPQKNPALPWTLRSLLFVSAEMGGRLFCWTTEHLVGQSIQLCDQDAICTLRSQLGRSVLGFPGQVGTLRKGTHEMVR